MTNDAVSERTRSKVRFNEFLMDLKKKEKAKARKRIAKLPKKKEENPCKKEVRYVQWRKKRAKVAVVQVEMTPVLKEKMPSYPSPSY